MSENNFSQAVICAMPAGMRQFYVYVDFTEEDAPRPFYVGKGCGKRAQLSKRNTLHARIRAKYGCVRKKVFLTTDEHAAFAVERELIAFFCTYVYSGWGANLTLGGEGTSGAVATPEKREKLSKANKGTRPAKSTLDAAARVHKGVPLTKEHRDKLSVAGRGRKLTAEERAKISAANKGRTISESARRAVAEANRRRVISDATRQKMSQAHKGRKLSEKAREALKNAKRAPMSAAGRAAVSAASRARVASAEAREKMRLAQTGRKHRPETIQKIREAAIVREQQKKAAACTK